MSKKVICYLFIIILNLAWVNNAYAGTDMINNLLLKVNNTIEKFSHACEKISSTILDITQNKIMGRLEGLQADMQRLQDRIDYAKKAYEDVMHSDSATNLRNLIEGSEIESMETRFEEIRRNSIKVLEERGWINNNSGNSEEGQTVTRKTDDSEDGSEGNSEEGQTITRKTYDGKDDSEGNSEEGQTITRKTNKTKDISEDKNNIIITVPTKKELNTTSGLTKKAINSDFITKQNSGTTSLIQGNTIHPVSSRKSFITMTPVTEKPEQKDTIKEKINAEID